MWAISADDPERMIKFAEAEGIGYTILHDPEGWTFHGYGIRNENDDRTIPHPTVIIVDQDRIAKLVISDDNYRVRVPTASLVERLDRYFPTEE